MALTVEEVEAVLRLRDEMTAKLQTATRGLDSFASTARAVGAGLTATLTTPIVAVGAGAITMAMHAVESENLFEVAFGGMAAAAREWSEETSQALGLNEFELRRTSGTLFTMFDSMGLAEDAAFAMATGLTQLSADMASFFNLRPEEAFQKLQAGITGEAEPLKRLGILIDETTVKTFAYTSGIAKQGEELTQQQKVLARYGSIMEQTSKAQGDLARTIESPTNQLRIMGEQVKELAVKLGMALMPAFEGVLGHVKSLVPFLSSAVEAFAKLPEPVRLVAVGVAAVAAAIGPLLLVLSTLTPGLIALYGILPSLAAVAGVFGGALALLVSPIGLVVLGIAALLTATDSWGTAWGGLKAIVSFVTETMKAQYDVFVTIVGYLWRVVDATAGAMGGWDTWKRALDDTNPIQRAVEATKDLWTWMKAAGEKLGFVAESAPPAVAELGLLADRGIKPASEAFRFLNTDAGTIAGDGLPKVAAASDAAREAAEKYAKEVKALRDELSGAKLQGDLKQVMEAFAGLPPSVRANEEVAKRYREAIVALNIPLKELPPALFAVVMSAQKVAEGLGGITAAAEQTVKGFGFMPGIIDPVVRGFRDVESNVKSGIPVLTEYGDLIGEDLPIQTYYAQQAIDDWLVSNARIPPELREGRIAAGDFGGSLKDLAASLAHLSQITGGALDGWATFIGALAAGFEAGKAANAGIEQIGKGLAGLRDPSVKASSALSAIGQGIVQVASSIPAMIAAMDAATSHGNRFANALSGAATAAQIGNQIFPGVGAAIGAAAGAIFGFLRGVPEHVRVAQEALRDFGVEISEKLARQIADAAKKIGDRWTATMLHLADVVREAGGVTVDNFARIAAATHDLFSGLERGQLTLDQVNKQFGILAPQLVTVALNANASQAAFDSFIELMTVAAQAGADISALGPAIANFVKPALRGSGELFERLLALIDVAHRFGADLTALGPAIKDFIEPALRGSDELFERLLTLIDVAQRFGADLTSLGPSLAHFAEPAIKGSDELFARFMLLLGAAQDVGVDLAELQGSLVKLAGQVGTMSHVEFARFVTVLQATGTEIEGLAESIRSQIGSAVDAMAKAISSGTAVMSQSMIDLALNSQQAGQFIAAASQVATAGFGELIGNLTVTEANAASVARTVTSVFQGALASGLPVNELFRAMGPGLRDLEKQFVDLGLEGTGAWRAIHEVANIANNEIANRAVAAAQGATQAMVGLHSQGLLTQDMFRLLTSTVFDSFKAMELQGLGGEQALRRLQPQLQTVWELQQRFGLVVDDGTQSLLDQATAAGIVGAAHQTEGQRSLNALQLIVDRLGILIQLLGGEVPAATGLMAEATSRAAGQAGKALKEDMGDALQRLSVQAAQGIPGALDEMVLATQQAAKQSEAALEATMGAQLEQIAEQAANDVPEALSDLSGAAKTEAEATKRALQTQVGGALTQLGTQASIDLVQQFAAMAHDGTASSQELADAMTLALGGALLVLTHDTVPGLMSATEAATIEMEEDVANVTSAAWDLEFALGPSGVIGTFGAAGSAAVGFANTAVPAIEDVSAAVNALNFGSSPGGLTGVVELLYQIAAAAGISQAALTGFAGAVIAQVAAANSTLAELLAGMTKFAGTPARPGTITSGPMAGFPTMPKILTEEEAIARINEVFQFYLSRNATMAELAMMAATYGYGGTGKIAAPKLEDFLKQLATGYIQSQLVGLQGGGIVRKPTLALVGERGPERVEPLNADDDLLTELRAIRQLLRTLPSTVASAAVLAQR